MLTARPSWFLSLQHSWQIKCRLITFDASHRAVLGEHAPEAVHHRHACHAKTDYPHQSVLVSLSNGKRKMHNKPE